MKEIMTAAKFREEFCNIAVPTVTVKYAKPVYDFYIGIDAGTKTGFAMYSTQTKKFINVQTMMIHQAMEDVLHFSKNHKIKVIVEDARQRKRFGENSEHKLQGAGSVKRDCTIWEDYLTYHKIDFEMVHPQKGMTKMDDKQFKKITGYTGRTSEHGRDAGMLVFGRK